MIRVPDTDNLVIVYDQIQEDKYVNEDFPRFYSREAEDYRKHTGRELTMYVTCSIPEIDVELHTRCFACRIDENGQFSQFVYDTMAEAVDLEIEWCEYVLRDLDGLDVSEMRDYVKYLANKRIRVIGLNDLYEGFDEDVMPWIRAYSDDSLNATKSDFFEQKSRSYAKVTDANGFDDL